jgi:subtilisin family serine protease
MERRKIKIISSSPTGIGYWILLAEDEDLNEIIDKLKDYGEEEKYKIFDIIDSFDPIPPEEKIGRSLLENPMQDTEIAYLDLEIWRMEKEKLKEFLSGFKDLIAEKDGKITDELITDNLCLLRIKINKKTFEDIIKLREISKIDRPPRPYIEYQMLSIPLEQFDYVNAPKENSVAIGVIDSGIISSHPLLKNAVGDELFVPGQKNKNQIESPVDDVGHGTKVASVALYGDIKKCIEERVFNPEIWILSAKIMYKSEGPNGSKPIAKYDDDKLLEHQFERTVNYFIENYKNCKVINISFGNNLKEMYENERQFPLATLIDELAKKHNIIFVVSTGNLNWKNFGFPDEYPNYLINEDRNVKIIDPSSSAYAITVGSICQEYMPGPRNEGQNLNLFDQQEINYSPAKTDYPSPFTRVGPGYKGMIKPELVETGGNVIITPSDPQQFPDISSNLILLKVIIPSKHVPLDLKSCKIYHIEIIKQ